MDAVGNELTDAAHIGHRNSFRYRGYFYETVSGLYYLKSRYYDSVTGRFFSPDSVEYLDPETIGGLNLYAYCNNNPVMNVDPDGHFVISLGVIALALAIGVGVAATANDIYQLASGRVFAQISEKGDVEIKNSKNLVTSIVQTAYVFYLNHIDSTTKDIIKGTTSGAQGELLAHNLAYYAMSAMTLAVNLVGGNTSELEKMKGFANPANIGGTVFDNGDNRIAKGMVAFNILTRPIATLIDFLVWKFG